MTKVALVVIYNHRYDRNIDVVERIHGKRFSHIFHLMPFYTGDRANVIPVYENSYYFQGFIAQAWRHFRREEFTHYFFVSDDMVLNPSIDEHGFLDQMGLPEGDCFLPSTVPFHLRVGFWSRTVMAYEWRMRTPGIEPEAQLPTPAEARELLRRHGIEIAPVPFEQIWETPASWRGWVRKAWDDPVFFARYLRHVLGRRSFELPYPMIGSYADIFVVTAAAMPRFAHYCGVLAATRLFVEHAIPTALALAADSITTDAGLRLRGRALWTPAEMKELDRYGRSLRSLLAEFPPDRLFLHPIKFSRWIDDLDANECHPIELERILRHPGHRNQVDGLELRDGALAFRSMGSDPYLPIPPVAISPGRRMWVRIDCTAPEPTGAQVYYLRAGETRFSEDASVRCAVVRGRQRLVFAIEDPGSGTLRFDPGGRPGEYRIHAVDVLQ